MKCKDGIRYNIQYSNKWWINHLIFKMQLQIDFKYGFWETVLCNKIIIIIIIIIIRVFRAFRLWEWTFSLLFYVSCSIPEFIVSILNIALQLQRHVSSAPPKYYPSHRAATGALIGQLLSSDHKHNSRQHHHVWKRLYLLWWHTPDSISNHTVSW